MTPNELGYKGGLFSSFFGKSDDAEDAKFTGERPRASLTDPPAGYQVPSPDQPYGPGKAAGPKAEDYYLSRGSDNTSLIAGRDCHPFPQAYACSGAIMRVMPRRGLQG